MTPTLMKFFDRKFIALTLRRLRSTMRRDSKEQRDYYTFISISGIHEIKMLIETRKSSTVVSARVSKRKKRRRPMKKNKSARPRGRERRRPGGVQEDREEIGEARNN